MGLQDEIPKPGNPGAEKAGEKESKEKKHYNP